MDVRTRGTIPVVERAGYRYRQYLGALETASDLFSSAHVGFSALRVFDDVVLEVDSRASFRAHDGLETVLYVLEGAGHVAHDGGQPVELRRGVVAHIVGGREKRYEVHNRMTSPLRLLLAAFVAPGARAQSPFTTRAFDPDAGGMVWLATPSGEEQSGGCIALGAAVRFGIASLAPGVEARFPSATDRGLYLSVLQGDIELNTGFLDEGGDARLSLESGPARIQGVTPARVAIVDVPMGFVQEL